MILKGNIKDTGLGIKVQDSHRLFKLFGKINDGDSRNLNKTGIGLGLSICKKII